MRSTSRRGTEVRVVSSRSGRRTGPAWFARHVGSLLGRPAPATLGVADFNERFLADSVREQRPGRYADPEFLDSNCVVVEPAVDRRVFHPPCRSRGGTKRLPFCARPANPRNLFGLGIEALRGAVAAGVFGATWEFIGIGGGGSLPPMKLGGGYFLCPEPWESYGAYAETLRGAEILRCPMLSPHTSDPVLEMAACAGTVVTNVFGPETAAELARPAADIVGVDPDPDAFLAGLRKAVSRGGAPRAVVRWVGSAVGDDGMPEREVLPPRGRW